MAYPSLQASARTARPQASTAFSQPVSSMMGLPQPLPLSLPAYQDPWGQQQGQQQASGSSGLGSLQECIAQLEAEASDVGFSSSIAGGTASGGVVDCIGVPPPPPLPPSRTGEGVVDCIGVPPPPPLPPPLPPSLRVATKAGGTLPEKQSMKLSHPLPPSAKANGVGLSPEENLPLPPPLPPPFLACVNSGQAVDDFSSFDTPLPPPPPPLLPPPLPPQLGASFKTSQRHHKTAVPPPQQSSLSRRPVNTSRSVSNDQDVISIPLPLPTKHVNTLTINGDHQLAPASTPSAPLPPPLPPQCNETPQTLRASNKMSFQRKENVPCPPPPVYAKPLVHKKGSKTTSAVSGPSNPPSLVEGDDSAQCGGVANETGPSAPHNIAYGDPPSHTEGNSAVQRGGVANETDPSAPHTSTHDDPPSHTERNSAVQNGGMASETGPSASQSSAEAKEQTRPNSEEKEQILPTLDSGDPELHARCPSLGCASDRSSWGRVSDCSSWGGDPYTSLTSLGPLYEDSVDGRLGGEGEGSNSRQSLYVSMMPARLSVYSIPSAFSFLDEQGTVNRQGIIS